MRFWESIPLPQLLLFVGLAYIGVFGLLARTRHEQLSLQFALEGLLITLGAVALSYWGKPVNPILFFFVLYTVTMRARWMADLGNLLVARRRYKDGLIVFNLALSLWPDVLSRRIVEINKAVAFLRLGYLDKAREMLERVLRTADQDGLAPKHVAAAHYNLGIIARAQGDEQRAKEHFNLAVEIAPHSIYAYGAMQALAGKPLAGRRRAEQPDAAPAAASPEEESEQNR